MILDPLRTNDTHGSWHRTYQARNNFLCKNKGRQRYLKVLHIQSKSQKRKISLQNFFSQTFITFLIHKLSDFVNIFHLQYFKQTQKGCKNYFFRNKMQKLFFIKKCRSPMVYKLKIYGRQKRDKFTLTLIIFCGYFGLIRSP